MSCRSEINDVEGSYPRNGNRANYAWTDITYLLHKSRVSWRYYVANGTTPDCANGNVKCPSFDQFAGTPTYWNPLPWFTTVRKNKQRGNVQEARHFFGAARKGKLPKLAWIIPDREKSEHPSRGHTIADGQAWVTRVVNAVMRSPQWESTAIFLAWDDWGGFYDHVRPPRIDGLGYGLRVPGLLIRPWARRGYI